MMTSFINGGEEVGDEAGMVLHCDADSLEDVTNVNEGTSWTKEPSEIQDVTAYKTENQVINHDFVNETKENGNCGNVDSQSVDSASGSVNDVEVAQTTPEKYTGRVGRILCNQGTSQNHSENVDHVQVKSAILEKQGDKSRLPRLQTSSSKGRCDKVIRSTDDRKITRRRTVDITPVNSRLSRSTTSLLRQNSESGKGLGDTPRQRNPLQLCTSVTPSECHGIRETLASRLRFEKGHVAHDNQDCDCPDYATPTQRREMELTKLRKEVRQLKKDLAERVEEIDLLKKNIDKEAAIIIEEKDIKIQEVREELEKIQANQEELRLSYEETVKKSRSLEETIDEMKDAIAVRERKNAEIFLEMYRKGQESAKFERDFELETMAAKSDKATSVTVKELLDKLMSTEVQLAKWQSLRRRESYESADRPETEAAATMRFLKDSFFHYITDPKESDNHLRAMIRIFNYSDVQKKKIASSIAERMSKKKNF